MTSRDLNFEMGLRGLIFITLYFYAALTFNMSPFSDVENLKLIGLACLIGPAMAWWKTRDIEYPLSRSFILSFMTTINTFGVFFTTLMIWLLYLCFENFLTDPNSIFADGITLSNLVSMIGILIGYSFAVLFTWLIALVFNVIQSIVAAFIAGLIATFNPVKYAVSIKRLLKLS